MLITLDLPEDTLQALSAEAKGQERSVEQIAAEDLIHIYRLTAFDKGDRRLLNKTIQQLEVGPKGLQNPREPLPRWAQLARFVQRGLMCIDEITPLVWCSIHLGVDQISNENALLHISFCNLSDEILPFCFFSSSVAAWETCMREVVDGEMVPLPDPWPYARPRITRRSSLTKRWLSPGEIATETRVIRRNEAGTAWNIPAVRSVASGETIHLQLDYCGLLSNVLTWHLP